MTHTATSHNDTLPLAGRSTAQRHGADLERGDSKLVVFARQGKPPLRFRGRRRACHWAHLSETVTIHVDLWEQGKKGLVISFSDLKGDAFRTRAVQVSNVAEASSCIEDICESFERAMPADISEDRLWTDLHLHLCFRQRFAQLASEVLADWTAIDERQESIT